MTTALKYLTLILVFVACGDNLPPREAVDASADVPESVGVEVTAGALDYVTAPGHYRAEATRTKRYGTYNYGTAYAGANYTTSASRCCGTVGFHAIRQNDLVDFPGDCSFDMVAYYDYYGRGAFTDPLGSIGGYQYVWRNGEGTCVWNGRSQVLPRDSIQWWQTRPEFGYLVEKGSFQMGGYAWTVSGTLTPQ